MVKISNCLECNQCCNFEPYVGKVFTEQKLAKYFSFNSRLCKTFFNKIEDKYIFGRYCKQYNAGKCDLYHGDLFPFACAIYPFIIASKPKGGYKLVIDRNCPHWRVVVDNTDQLFDVVKKYAINDAIDTFQEKDLIRMGYKIITIQDDIHIT